MVLNILENSILANYTEHNRNWPTRKQDQHARVMGQQVQTQLSILLPAGTKNGLCFSAGNIDAASRGHLNSL